MLSHLSCWAAGCQLCSHHPCAVVSIPSHAMMSSLSPSLLLGRLHKGSVWPVAQIETSGLQGTEALPCDVQDKLSDRDVGLLHNRRP